MITDDFAEECTLWALICKRVQGEKEGADIMLELSVE